MAATKELKQGVKAAALINIAAEFAPSTQRAMLETVHRSTAGLSDAEIENAVREYFSEIAQGPSDPDTVVELRRWGGAETLLMAVKALARPVFLVRGTQRGVTFAVYEPAT